jgi:predicted DNA-binding transcriptional regulator AlpA
MTLIETERRRVQRESTREDMRVIRWKEWCESKGISRWAAHRLRKSGNGPRIVRLGPRMIGVTVRDDREWTEAQIKEGALRH